MGTQAENAVPKIRMAVVGSLWEKGVKIAGTATSESVRDE